MAEKEPKEWELALAAMSGKTVKQLRAEEAAREQQKAGINARLKTAAKRKCFMSITVREFVEVDCDGCDSDEGKRSLFIKAIKAFAECTGIEADITRDELTISVEDAATKDHLFSMESSPAYQDFIRDRHPEASDVECIKIDY